MFKCVPCVVQRVIGQDFKIGSVFVLFKNKLTNSEKLCIYYRLGMSFWELLCGVMCWDCDLLMAFMLTFHGHFPLCSHLSILTSISLRKLSNIKT